MAIQQLTQPIINPIAAFDATQNHVVTFLAIGGAQVVGNRIVISDNQTGKTVYDNRVITMQLAHTIPANTLTNGGYYNVVIYTIDSANNFSQASVPVPFYCYSQPTLTINNIPASSTIENGTYTFQGSYAQQENEILNSYQFILYDSNKTVLSQSDVIYYSSNDSLSYTFVGMSNDTSYYIELKGQTVNNTEITTGLLYFTVRYSQPASFAIVDLVNDCENGFIQISSNIVAIDGKSNPEPPIYIDNKEVDLREPDSWVRWDEGFNIKDDFTMRVWGRDFNDFEPIITLSNKNNTDSEPNKIEMKWMIADIMKILPDYTLVSGKNISIVDGHKTDINDLAIYGNSEQATREGYNLLNNTLQSQTINGLKVTVNMDKSVKVVGTATDATPLIFDQSKATLPAGTYILKDCSTYIESEENHGSWGSGEARTFTAEATLSGSGFYKYYAPGEVVNVTLYPMLIKGSELKPYEQYGQSPSPDFISNIYSSGDKKNQLEDLGEINVSYNQEYFKTTDTNFVLKPDFVYNLSFDYTINSATTDLYFTVSYKNNSEIVDISNASQYTNQTTGRNNISFIVPADIPANSTLSIKFARTIIQADVSVSVNNVALVKGRFAADYQSPDIYNIYPTATQKNIFNYTDIYYIKNQNATLTFIQNGFSSEVVTTGEKSFFEFGFPNILQPGNKYAISYNSYGAIKSAKVYTMDKETGKTLKQIVTENGVFTAPSNLYDIKAEFVLDDSVADNQVQVWNIQLESGEQVTEAETYTANNTDLTLEQPLRGIRDYRDLACLESPNILNPETQTAIVKGSTTYSLSQSGTTAYKFDYINENNNIISSENMASGQFTTPDNCIRIKFDTTSDIITTNKLQVNLGNTAMVYYPYVNEPSVIRYISERILDGSPGHSFLSKHSTIYTSERGFYSLQLPNATEKGYGTVNYGICNYLTYIKGTAAQAIYKTGLWWEGGNTHINYASIPFTTLNKANQWLTDLNNKGNPLTIEYVLNNPIVEPLSSDNILALQNLKTYEGISNVFANNSMPANLNLSYISGQSKQETKNTYVTLKCWNGNVMPYFIHSNYIDIPKETDKIFIWLRRKNNIFDLKIENLGDYGEDKPGNKGNPQVAITIDDTTTTTITVTANVIDTATLSNVRFSKDNGATWDAEIPLDGLSSTDTYTFTGLQPATTYQIRVEATNVNGITGGITQQVITRAS